MFASDLGGNFGWNKCEGLADYEGSCPSDTIKPVFVASHSDGNCSVIGGLVVLDRKVPSLFGRYIFSDFCNSGVRSFKPGFSSVASAPSTGISKPSISSYGQSPSHKVYATSLEGPIYRLTR